MEPSPLQVSTLLSNLVDRPVQMARADDPNFSKQTRFATYLYEPDRSTLLVKIDLSALAWFAGLLIGLPSSQIEAQANKGALDESMTDAAREVMNILSSAVVDEGRAIFKNLYETEKELPIEAQKMLRRGAMGRLSLKCNISGKTAGFMDIHFS